ncbi:MAG: cytochrome P450 [Planctomycetaceae bacterium]|nr:cytochrome P450 [Planctomycetaceae bacterium]
MNQVIRTKDAGTRLPKGPRGTWGTTIKLIRDPRAALEGWAKEFGDPFFFRPLNGPVVVTGREDLLRTIHSQDPAIYEPFAMQTTVPLLGSGSMLVLHGERHKRERRMMSPMFQGERMKLYGGLMQEIAIESIEQHRQQNPAQVSTADLMQDISLRVIIRTIFGGDNPQLAEKMFVASKVLANRASPLLFFTSRTHVRFLGLTPWDRWLKARRELCDLLDIAIDARLKESEPRGDILSLLCRATYEDGQPMTRDDIYAELLTFLFAGHETTALSLTWAIYHIFRAPLICEKLRNELDALPNEAPVGMAEASYLKATIQETLRVNPIVTETLRKLREPLELGEYQLPAGMGLALATVLAHYNPQTYPEPDLFRPERFIEQTFSPFQYMPFGGGHRRCIGAAFATYEMAMVLGVFLRRYDFQLLDTRPVVPKRRSVTMGPSSSVPVKIVKR